MAIANWFRKPENREKAKRAANRWLDKNQNKRRDNNSGPNQR